MKLQALIIIICMVLAGCSIPPKSDKPQVHTYRLTPHIKPQNANLPRLDAHLYIPQIEVTPGLDSKNIVLLKAPHEQDIIAHSQWPDELSTYLQAVITDALSASNTFATVSNKLVNNDRNYKLLLKVSAFQAELAQPTSSSAKVVVKMEAFVIHSKSQKLKMHRRYHVEGGNIQVRVSTLVKALNQALNETLALLNKDLKNNL